MIMMNLSVAAVINALTEASLTEDNQISKVHIEALLKLWAEYDHYATAFITLDDLICLMCELPPPLGSNHDRYNSHGKRIQKVFEPIVIPDIKNVFR